MKSRKSRLIGGYQTGSHGEKVEVVGLRRIMKEVHERACQDDDSNQSSSNPKRTIKIWLILEDFCKGRSHEDG